MIESYIGGLFFNFYYSDTIQTALEELSNHQVSAPIITNNSVSTGIVAGEAKQKLSQEVYILFY